MALRIFSPRVSGEAIWGFWGGNFKIFFIASSFDTRYRVVEQGACGVTSIGVSHLPRSESIRYGMKGMST